MDVRVADGKVPPMPRNPALLAPCRFASPVGLCQCNRYAPSLVLFFRDLVNRVLDIR
jgi:hypothetical protein